jgi:uncharacterized protein YciI
VNGWIYVIRPADAGMLTAPTEEQVAAMREHVAYLERLRDDGLVLLAGPSVAAEDVFGIVVLETEDEATARAAMERDPAVSMGVMLAELRPFRIAVSRS